MDATSDGKDPCHGYSPIGNVWQYLVAALACLANGVYGIRKGKVLFFYRSVLRSEEPSNFWGGVIVSLVLGILGLAIYLPQVL